MIVVDTNVVSELVKPDRSWRVVDWFDRNIREIALATPSIAELRIGVLAMADGRRKAEIAAAYLDIFDLLAERILTFDRAAAMSFADIAIACKQRGKPINTIDCQIAAIAQTHRAGIATRDADFAATGARLINPWDYDP